ncbi:related to feruloyl esterase B precursor [Cephalotrichum gorgonifer]|uniref:Carboxylic ester hydrolase n=1 Tax=Cephalotrichum gorgonifer TaxID=2041049 RepID=A0AAE8N7G7_9PEZI|nr:related to feruloyl esterase B precursor [Cephalotrichum gorgonifer]
MSLKYLCTAGTFDSLPLLGAEILSVETSLVTNYTATSHAIYRFIQPSVEVKGINFCNITVSYTHPGQNDNILVETWLPVDTWNERLQAVGGASFTAGRTFLSYYNMNGALADGYATVTTDAGLGSAADASEWALVSPGNVNLYNLQNLASISLNDEAIIAKSLIKSFYGKDPAYSYFNGCSQGGRQGLLLAQRYPDAYDGIAAGAPALYWNELLSSMQWPQQVMSMNGYPHGCELDAIVAATVKECDPLDGVEDGIISDINACLDHFDPFSLVGSSAMCIEGGRRGDVLISQAAATVVKATWDGMRTADGKQLWLGYTPGTALTASSSGVAGTDCSSGSCVGVPIFLGSEWLRYFVAKDLEFDLTHLEHKEFDDLVHQGKVYESFLATNDPDLSRFRDAGGKLVTFHGLADNLISSHGTERYYRAVSDLLPDTRDFYRYFEVPGMAHCWGGKSGQPESLFEQLREWVEGGTAPDETPVKITDLDGKVQDRVLCSYPRKAKFDELCGEPGRAECWGCAETDR